jgi:hypothetical protein
MHSWPQYRRVHREWLINWRILLYIDGSLCRLILLSRTDFLLESLLLSVQFNL